MHENSPNAHALKRKYCTTITRVMFRNKNGTARQDLLAKCKPGDALVLQRDQKHPHDKFAIRVLNYNSEQLGYVASDFLLATHFDNGGKALAMVIEVNGGPNFLQKLCRKKGVPYSCKIQISKQDNKVLVSTKAGKEVGTAKPEIERIKEATPVK